jgi:hypothetical protein
VNHGPPRNIYFELTEAFDTGAPNVALASGQAVVYYRIAIMSKDGDWIIRETPDASSIGKTLVWMLSDDDVNLVEMSDEELDAAWDLWFDLAQATNESDPPYTHGALAYMSTRVSAKESATHSPGRGTDVPSRED